MALARILLLAIAVSLVVISSFAEGGHHIPQHFNIDPKTIIGEWKVVGLLYPHETFVESNKTCALESISGDLENSPRTVKILGVGRRTSQNNWIVTIDANALSDFTNNTVKMYMGNAFETSNGMIQLYRANEFYIWLSHHRTASKIVRERHAGNFNGKNRWKLAQLGPKVCD